MSPSKSKTIVLPSGLTSNDIHVPSSVFKSKDRSGLIGKFLLDFSFFSFSSILS